MPYTPEYNIKWVLNVDIPLFPAVIRDPFDRENCDLICAACTSTELGIRTGISKFLSAELIATSAAPYARVGFSLFDPSPLFVERQNRVKLDTEIAF